MSNYKLVEFTKRKVFVIGLQLPESCEKNAASSIDEICSLAKTLQLDPIGYQIQKRNQIHTKSYLGTGKCEELKREFQEIKPEILFVDGQLTLKQEKQLSDFFSIQVWDKTKIILKIFEKNAKTNEAKDQVELATLEYMLPRLSGMWQHLDREKGGAGVSKGMGEKQINIDRHLIRKRISFLKRKVQKYQKTVGQQLKKSKNSFRVSLIGYTNVGKSSLMNELTKADVLVQNKWFATLSTTTRKIKTSENLEILLSDTVGFIHNLPHSLIASFRSTFSAIKTSDLLLHIIELDTPEQMEKSLHISEKILKQLTLDEIPRNIVINKIDKKNEYLNPLYFSKEAIWVSSFQKDSISDLSKYIQNFFQKKLVYKKYFFSYHCIEKISFLYKHAIIKKIQEKPSGINFEVQLSHQDATTMALLEG